MLWIANKMLHLPKDFNLDSRNLLRWTNVAARLSNNPNCQGTHKIQRGYQLVKRQLKNRNHSSFLKIVPPKIFIKFYWLSQKIAKLSPPGRNQKSRLTFPNSGQKIPLWIASLWLSPINTSKRNFIMIGHLLIISLFENTLFFKYVPQFGRVFRKSTQF